MVIVLCVLFLQFNLFLLSSDTKRKPCKYYRRIGAKAIMAANKNENDHYHPLPIVSHNITTLPEMAFRIGTPQRSYTIKTNSFEYLVKKSL